MEYWDLFLKDRLGLTQRMDQHELLQSYHMWLASKGLMNREGILTTKELNVNPVT